MSQPKKDEFLVRGMIATICPDKASEIEERADELIELVLGGMSEMEDEAKAAELMAISLFGVKLQSKIHTI